MNQPTDSAAANRAVPAADPIPEISAAEAETNLSAPERAFLDKLRLTAREGRPVPLLHLLQVKRALKAAYPLEEAFARYRALLELGPNVTLRRQRVESFSALSRRHAETVHVLHEGGEHVVLNPSPILGASAARVIEGPTRRVEVAAFRNAAAFARTSTIRLRNGTFIFDVQDGELDRMPVDSAFDPAVFHRDGETVFALDDRRRMNALTIPEAISLLGIDTVSFGHWMAEEFLKFLSIRSTVGIAGIPVLIDANMPRQHKQSIAAFLPANHPLIEVPRNMRVEAGRLWVATNWFYSPKILTTDVGIDANALVMPTKPIADILRAAFDELEAKVGLGTAAEGSGEGRRLFIARDAERHRAITNHEATAATLARHGYVETRPEALSFIEQFQLYRRADRIVAQTGSATNGVAMCRPGTRVCLLSHPAMPLQALWAQPLADIGLHVVALVGDFAAVDKVYEDKSTYRIDGTALDQLLTSELEMPA
ncbi:glycosyltransferase family 61 protein [Acuticoccus sediminis]|uniref:glycosyltransferase family 61 protein n=1 Tax=Acuticoccus sediminis TaxID=2184697 RepID=UPI001CFE1632|nr:glycosyltransferase family 61 protein [Acuticoccus sediminis]